MKKKIIAPIALLTIFLYILVHEFGHVIVVWSVGGDITRFSVLTAHVYYEGGNWTDTSDLWNHLNGSLLPLIMSFVYMLFYRRERTNVIYRIASFFVTAVPAATLLVWIGIPIMSMFGFYDPGDDVCKFLYNFTYDGTPAWIVSVVAALVLAGFIATIIRKGIFANCREAMKSLVRR